MLRMPIVVLMVGNSQIPLSADLSPHGGENLAEVGYKD